MAPRTKKALSIYNTQIGNRHGSGFDLMFGYIADAIDLIDGEYPSLACPASHKKKSGGTAVRGNLLTEQGVQTDAWMQFSAHVHKTQQNFTRPVRYASNDARRGNLMEA